VNRGVLILAMVSALCLGGSLGFMGGVVFSRWHLRDGPGHFERRRFGRHGGERGVPSARHLVPRLQRMLGLTPAQSEAIRGEIERTRGEFAIVRDSLHERIARHLTPEQRDRWRTAMKERNPGDPRGLDPQREGDPTR
jgi:hypothetical protein